MRPARTITLLLLGSLGFARELPAQPQQDWDIKPMSDAGVVEYAFQTGKAFITNGVVIRYGGGVLSANCVSVDQASGEVIADGGVRIQQEDQIWAGEHIRFNFKTKQMQTDAFRMGQPPNFAGGRGLAGDVTNKVYTATNTLITADDIAEPLLKVRAKRVIIIPGDRIKAYDAVVYIGEVPVFYWPYYTRSLKRDQNHFGLTPGYRSKFGAFALGLYTWLWDEHWDGVLHADYREKRGVGLGPDVNYHLGQWGDGSFKYYYLHDQAPDTDATTSPNPNNRQRVDFSYKANLATNFYVQSVVRYQNDPDVIRDFFEGDYRLNPQPNSYLEANRFWSNFSLDGYVQPQVNTFLETVERLPDIRLTGYRQQLGVSPLYYESESSVGYYRRMFADTNGLATTPSYSAGRADTYHQVLRPLTFFGWLNLTPRVGGRFTYYTETDGVGATNKEEFRGVFNTGAELSFKASRLWPGARNDFFEVDGVRHIVVPSLNYVYVPSPTAKPSELPQFDSELPSFRLLPIEYTDYNAIDSIDSENVVRLGLHNKLQTKRNGQVADLAKWDVYTDWRLQPRSDQTTFADLYSDLVVKPRSWLTLGSITRYDIENHRWRMSFSTLTMQPTDNWRWRLGHLYMRDDLSASPTALGYGNNLITSDLMFKMNENWGLGASHYFDVLTGRMQEQRYSIFRDLRSWTAALSFQMRDDGTGKEDYTVAFTFSLKAYPKLSRGYESGGAYWLSGD